ncbi:MAG: isocitrate lyase/PEP mutase family protein [Hyphomicrobiales bacterium]|nr:isocitrate lyase/PEP mutase family protein [Hyphomicrobiales bacterium]
MLSQPDKLRALLKEDRLHVMPCCFDALSARMIAQAGFEISFMSGFAVSAARIGAPDTGLISYGEMLDQGRNICAAVDIPVIGDGDTGYGNALNVRRTVEGYARAGFAAVMIEDQVMPKRCGHTRGKTVVDRAEAFERVRAAVDARNEGTDILILARTDARATDGLAEAIARGQAFAELGADILFVESPRSDKEMRQICAEIPGVHMANLLEGGDTPILPPDALKEMGYRLAAFPLTLISAAMKRMADALNALKAGRQAENILDFAQLRKTVGFNAYYDLEARYARGWDGAAEFKKR